MLAVIAGIAEIAEIAVGIYLAINHNSHSVLGQLNGIGASAVLGYGIAAIIIGLIYLAVAKGLANGNNFSRFLVGLFSVISLAGGVYLAIARSGQLRTQGIIGGAFAVLILLLLYNARASAFFRSR